MGILELFILAVGLSMDAFAVSICKGLAMDRINIKKAGIVGLWFGGFQAIMPLIGYFLGASFSRYIQSVDHWIAFVLLAFIGANMIRSAHSKADECCDDEASLSVRNMFMLAVATSIDALAVGVTFAFLHVNIWKAVLLIGVVTLVISAAGVKLGNVFGVRYKSKAEFAGGAILILLGGKILFEHLGVF